MVDTQSLWEPSASFIEKTRINGFKNFINSKYQLSINNYSELHAYSIKNIGQFWVDYIEFQGIEFSGSILNALPISKMPGAKWFPDVQLNYTEQIFKHVDKEQEAIVFVGENDGFKYHKTIFTYGQLEKQVHSIMGGLKKLNLKKGDVVAGCLSNTPEAAALALACSGLGIVWSSGSPDFGINTILGRFSQVKPKVFFLQSQYYYNGKTFKPSELANQIKSAIPSIQELILVPGCGEISMDSNWNSLVASENKFPGYESLKFQDPMYILYSSGTTGAPKCIVHGVGGVFLQHHKELSLHCNVGQGDRLLYFTTLGWMMWNWQLSGLIVGATICLYDGNPGYPDLSAIWRIVSALEVTHFGTSGKYLDTCLKTECVQGLGRDLDFTHLRSVMYTGSPLSERGYVWVYEAIKKDLHLAGICGGTDIISCFFLGNPSAPVHAGKMQCVGLGVDAVAIDDNGCSVIGKQGELYCRQPMPCMPVYFANDESGDKYRAAYFSERPEWWCHGDYIEINEIGEVVVYGRSDATLNPGGVRIGSAELYSALDNVPEVLGRIAVGYTPKSQSDEAIILCVVLKGEATLDDLLIKRIKTIIRASCSPRHVPFYVFQVNDIPVTHSGKIVELSVKKVLAGQEVKNKSALSNPESLIYFEEVRDKLLSLPF